MKQCADAEAIRCRVARHKKSRKLIEDFPTHILIAEVVCYVNSCRRSYGHNIVGAIFRAHFG
jgi:hypothetical protein